MRLCGSLGKSGNYSHTQTNIDSNSFKSLEWVIHNQSRDKWTSWLSLTACCSLFGNSVHCQCMFVCVSLYVYVCVVGSLTSAPIAATAALCVSLRLSPLLPFSLGQPADCLLAPPPEQRRALEGVLGQHARHHPAAAQTELHAGNTHRHTHCSDGDQSLWVITSHHWAVYDQNRRRWGQVSLTASLGNRKRHLLEFIAFNIKYKCDGKKVGNYIYYIMAIPPIYVILFFFFRRGISWELVY